MSLTVKNDLNGILNEDRSFLSISLKNHYNNRSISSVTDEYEIGQVLRRCSTIRQEPYKIRRRNSLTQARLTFPNFLVHMEDVEEREFIGQGAFARVVKILYKPTNEEYAMKELLDHNRDSLESILTELSTLRTIRHDNLLKFFGVVLKQRSLCLISEFIDGGPLNQRIINLELPFPWIQRLNYLRDIAAAMEYLHKLCIIHRDLNSPNCLIKLREDRVVVADFGLSIFLNRSKSISDDSVRRCLDMSSRLSDRRSLKNLSLFSSQMEILAVESKPANSATLLPRSQCSNSSPLIRCSNKHTHLPPVGSPYSRAPEMFAGHNYTEMVDVYSFGVIICEVMTRLRSEPSSLPRDERNFFVMDVKAIEKQGLINDDYPIQLVELCRQCCAANPDNRQPFENCLYILQKLVFLETRRLGVRFSQTRNP